MLIEGVKFKKNKTSKRLLLILRYWDLVWGGGGVNNRLSIFKEMTMSLVACFFYMILAFKVVVEFKKMPCRHANGPDIHLDDPFVLIIPPSTS